MDLQGWEELRTGSTFRNFYLNPKHKEFYLAEGRVVVFLGGWRGGKTTNGIKRVLDEIDGKHPLQKAGRRPMPPLKWRMMAVDFQTGVEQILRPKIEEIIPDHMEWSYDKKTHIYTLTNERGITSHIYCNSYDQETIKLAGVALDGVMMDEEAPYDVYFQNRARLLDKKGLMLLTFTPERGHSWSYHEIFKPWMAGQEDIKVIQISTRDNVDEEGQQRISEDEIMALCKGLSEDQIKSRIGGEYRAMGGLVWPEFSFKKHVLDKDIEIPDHWSRWCAIDPHTREPVHVLYVAVDPEGRKYVYDEMARRGPIRNILEGMAEIEHGHVVDSLHPMGDGSVKKIFRLYGRDKIMQRLMDPHGKTSEMSGDYETSFFDEMMAAGVTPLLEACKATVGRELVREWLKEDDGFYVLPRCKGFVDQIMSYQYDDHINKKKLKNQKEDVMKYKDHFCDCLKYLANHKIWYSSQ
jgi:phage terminase large subunit-like protein